MKWLDCIPEKLLDALDKPPYLQFFYIGSIFVIISLILNNHFDLVWLFFLLAIAGVIWRYIERDYLGHFGVKDTKQDEKNNKIRLVIVTIYHVGNLIWAGALIYFGLIA